MDLAAVIDEVGDALDTIAGLRISRGPAGSIQAPAAVVGLPDELTYDETYGRGSDRVRLPVIVAVGRPAERTTIERLGAYADGSGARSVKAVLEAHDPTSYGSLRVVSVSFDVVKFGTVDYAAALFTLDISGDGA